MDRRGFLKSAGKIVGLGVAAKLSGCGDISRYSTTMWISGVPVNISNGRKMKSLGPFQNAEHKHYLVIYSNPSDKIDERDFKTDKNGEDLKINIIEYKRSPSGERLLERKVKSHSYLDGQRRKNDVEIIESDGTKKYYDSMPDGLMEKVLLGKDYRK